MTPILVYGFPQGSSMGLVAALEWLGQPYALCRVDMFGEMRDPAYRRINPRVETPVLVTERGAPLTETIAIAAHLEARDDDRRISFDPRSPDADRMHRLMAFLNTGFTGAFSPLWSAMEMDPPNPALRKALREWSTAAVVERHDRLEELVGDQTFAFGDHPTLADGLLVGVTHWLDFHSVGDRGRWPKLAALRARIEADPAVIYAAALEAGEMHVGDGSCTGHVELRDVIERFGSPV